MLQMSGKPLINRINKPGFFHSRLQAWLKKRVPPQSSVVLTSRNIFIFPSKAGFVFLLFVMLLWLLATNYENNLVFALTYLLISLFIVSILHTYSNLSGLQLSLVGNHPAYREEDVAFELLVEKHNSRAYENIILSWPSSSPAVINLAGQDQQRVTLHVPAQRRGLLSPGRLLVETRYPLGLLRAWSWLDLNASALVFPAPVKAGPPPLQAGSLDQGDQINVSGNDDFYGFRQYQPSDPLKQVSWKHYAKGQGLLSKSYSETATQTLWFDWEHLPGLDRESRLSRLCYWVLEAAKRQDDYGLRLPGIEIPPGQGRHHKNKLLRELALFEWDQQ
jgi:uncharacterized protein (DUF58 family)